MPSKYVKKDKVLPDRFQPGFMARMDQRQGLTKSLQAAYQEICDDCGGVEFLSHVKRSLIERVVFLEFHVRSIERRMLTGEAGPDEIKLWIYSVNALNGLSKSVGLDRDRISSAIDALYSDPEPPRTTQDRRKDKGATPKTRKQQRPQKRPQEDQDDEW